MKTEQKLKSGLHFLTWREDKLFVARCLEVEVASQGKSKKDAIKNLEEALELYFEDEGLKRPKSLSDVELHLISSNVSYA